ncbi:MAG: hypothetical protein BGO41_02220 [Clostridiales bacterium 38-18]|nr:MAG: hypothetical protein BGO41_02220 [Clostridiales bacterium 38-18]
MQIYIVLILLFSILVTLFAIFNASVVTVSLFFVEAQISLALVIIISTLIGAVTVVLFDMFKKIKQGKQVKDLSKRIEALEKQIAVKDEAIRQRDQVLSEKEQELTRRDGIIKELRLEQSQNSLETTENENKSDEVGNQ